RRWLCRRVKSRASPRSAGRSRRGRQGRGRPSERRPVGSGLRRERREPGDGRCARVPPEQDKAEVTIVERRPGFRHRFPGLTPAYADSVYYCPMAGSLSTRFERYVAIGDSSTEGLDDPDGNGGYRGWANRLAERIAAVQGELQYANLGVRGRRTRQIRDEQLAPAHAMRPDLVTMISVSNYVVARSFDS